MDSEGSGEQSRRSNFIQIHGQVERSNDQRTPKTPCRGERTRNYGGNSLNSGRSSCRINSSGERTPVSACGQRSFPPEDPYDGKRTPKGRTVYLNKRNRRGVPKERSHTGETSGDGIRTHGAVDDSRYGTGSNSVSRRQSFQSTTSHSGHTQQSPNLSSGKGGATRKSTEGKNHSHKEKQSQGYKEKQSQGYKTSTEDSACSIFRGQWNENTNAVAKPEGVETSEVSVVQRFVDTQSKALDKSVDIDAHEEFNSKENVLTERKTVAAVLAFQRWRHTQLKRLFSLELKKVLEEAKEDEACLARLEQDLAAKNRHITQLRYQLTSYDNASETQMIQRHAIDANIKELQSEMLKALQRAATAEEELHKRDCEIHRLNDRLVSLEDEGKRIDSELQSSLTKLHSDRESAINESRILLSQLSRRDEEVTSQCKEIDKLRATIAHLSTREAHSQEEVETLKSEHRDEVNNLKDKLQHAFAARHAKEMELVSYTEKCSGLDQERQELLAQLHQALERADLASQRAEELQGKLHCTAEKRARASEDIAGEMVEQLKRLTGHMKELETSMDNTALRFPVGVFQKKVVVASLAKLSTKLAQAEAASLDILTHTDSLSEPPRSCPRNDDNRRQVCFSFSDEKNKPWIEADSIPYDIEKQNSIVTIDKDAALKRLKKWIAWKWRWAASATKAENLSKQLRLKQMATVTRDPILDESESREEQSRQKRDVSEPDELIMSDSEKNRPAVVKNKLGNINVKHKLVPVIMMAWRAFVRLSNLQRMASARNESLKKIISALPWWIRRVGERRALERYFFNWQLLALRANRAKIQEQQKQQRKLTRPRPPYKVGGNQQPPTAATVRLPSAITTIYRDAESQTETCSWSSGAERKQEKSSTGTRPIRQRVKLEPRPQVPNHTVRKNANVDGLRLATTQETKNTVNSTAPVKQLRGFQNPFQQELKEFQDTVSREMDSVDQIPAQRPHTTHGRLTGTMEANPAKQALKSVFGVCNDLAHALSEVRAQLFGAENQTRNPPVLDAGGKMKRSSTKYPEVHGDREGGEWSKSRDKDGSRQPVVPETTNHYAMPIGRVGRFKSPQRQQLGEAVAPRSSAYAPATIRNPQPQTVWQNHRGGEDELQYFQQVKDGRCISRQGRAEQQTVRRPFESARGLGEPPGGEKAISYDFKNAQVDSHPQGNTGGKYPYSETGRDDSDQLRSGGLERRQLVLSDSGHVEGRVARSRTLPRNDDPGLGTSLFKPPPDCLHTTVVQILNQDNNKIGEVAIHTHPLNGGAGTGKAGCISGEADPRSTTRLQSINDKRNCRGKLEALQEGSNDHPRPSSAPSSSRDQCRSSVRPTTAPRFNQTSTSGRQNNNALDRGPTMNFIASLRRKQCIGADYAELLRAEIIRLREDRISLEDKSLNATFGERKELPLIRRPGWRHVY